MFLSGQTFRQKWGKYFCYWLLYYSEKGILTAPPKKESRKLDENVDSIVIKFYEDNKYSRIMFRSKDYDSVGKEQHIQMQLLLLNLKELYNSFLKEHAYMKIGFLKFYQLQPKWCV